MSRIPSVGSVEGGSTRSSKREAVNDDSDATKQPRQRCCRVQSNPDLEPVQPGPDGKLRWKCLKEACAHINPMLEISIHKHVTRTLSHQDSLLNINAQRLAPFLSARMR
ncbi:hypothetical protein BDR05DRAFT_710090 [Suillus weaverae]|nr:hypothetical protein BDR05DRAFT_710090 [Suillus weaverae]